MSDDIKRRILAFLASEQELESAEAARKLAQAREQAACNRMYEAIREVPDGLYRIGSMVYSVDTSGGYQPGAVRPVEIKDAT